MKFGFVTCVQLGLSCMNAIYEAGGTIALAVTLPDDKAVGKSGRVFLDEFCDKNSVPLLKSAHVNDAEVLNAIVCSKIDWLFIIGWSQIASADILAAPRHGVLGIHPTLLPVGRGRAAIPWTILKELKQTGITLFKLDSGVDTGLIVDQIVIPMNPKITATELYSIVEQEHSNLIRTVIPKLIDQSFSMQSQDENMASIWPARKPEDGEIDTSGSAYDAEKLIRAITRPYPGAFFIKDRFKTIIWSARLIDINEKIFPESNYLEFIDGVLLIQEHELIILNN